ncbi:DUF4062 domain-containing protein [Maribacter sp. HTCC2170]|uniref:DUF4062 domain-containing protein n=1 Tax=Maribacter sp. (strain HTCC2170 / KCCM 42371) TaxID=313603 RepID=UPI00031D9C94|nr:DUF4062 domain-containing protein [Maribacter sp. HTCC2170]
MENSIEKLSDYYLKNGFDETKNLEGLFKFRPDFVYKKDDHYLGVYTRNSDSINSSILERIAQTYTINGIPSNHIIFFTKTPNSDALVDCGKNNIQVCYFENSKLKFIGTEELVIENEVQPDYEMPKMSIFISSKQIINERKQAIKIIERINLKYHKPIYPFAVELNKKGKVLTPKELKLEIMNGMDECDYFFGILTEDFSSATELEIQVALKMKKSANIRLYVKDDEETKETWKDLLFEIHMRYKTKGETIWYYPFLDKLDLEDEIRKDVMEIISKKHRDNNSLFL